MSKTFRALLFVAIIFSACSEDIDDDGTDVIKGQPEVTTISSDSIGLKRQKIFAEVTSEGEGVVTDRGFVWTVNESELPPTIQGNRVKAGAGIGEFDAILDSLEPGRRVFVRAYAVNQKGVGYGQTISFDRGYNTGMYYKSEGGYIAYLLKPGDPGYIPGEYHGLITLRDAIGLGEWGCSGTFISTSDLFGTGAQNTINIINGCSQPQIVARMVSNTTLNGKTDWFLPSKDELGKCFNYFNQNRQQFFGSYNNFATSSQSFSHTAWCARWNSINQMSLEWVENVKSFSGYSIVPFRRF